MGYRFIDSGTGPTRAQREVKIAALQRDPDPDEVCEEPEEPVGRDSVLNIRACKGWASDWLDGYAQTVEEEDDFAEVADNILDEYGHPYILDTYNPAVGGKCCPAPKCKTIFHDAVTEPWMTPDELFECCSTDITWEQAERAIQYASDLLYMATGRQFRGIRKELFRPGCNEACDVGCSCCDYPKLRLPGPIAGVCGIYVDGIALPLDSFRVSNDRNYLVRVDGLGWPQGNDLARDARELIVTRRVIHAPKPPKAERLSCRTGETQTRRLAPDCPEWVEPFLKVIGYTPDDHVAPEALSVGLCSQWAADYIAAHPELLDEAEVIRPWVQDWLDANNLKVKYGKCTKCCDKYGRRCAPSGATFVCSCDDTCFTPCAGAPGNNNHCCSREGCHGPFPANHCQTSCGCSKHVVKRHTEVAYAADSCDGELLQIPDPHSKPTPDWAAEILEARGITPELGGTPNLVTLPTFARRQNIGGPRLDWWVQDWANRNGYKDVTFGHCPECLDDDGDDCNGAGASYICCPHECEPAKVKPCKGTTSNANHCCHRQGCWTAGPKPSNHCQEGRCSCRAHSHCGGRSRLQFSCDDGTGIKYTPYGDDNTPLLQIDDPAAEPKEVTGWAAEYLQDNRIKLDPVSTTSRITLPTYASGNNGLWGWVDDYLNTNRGCKRLVIGYCQECADAECNEAGATVLVCNHHHRPAPCRGLSSKPKHCCFRDSPNDCCRSADEAHQPRPANHCQHGGCGCTIATNPICPPRPAVLSSAEDQGFGLLEIADPATEPCLEGWASEYLEEAGIQVDNNSGPNIVLPTFASSHNLPSWAQDWVDMTGECVNYGECPVCTDENGLECDPVTGAVYVCDCPLPDPEPEDPCDIPEGCVAIVRTVNGKRRRYISQKTHRHCCSQLGNECCNRDNPGPYHINCCQSGHSACAPDPQDPDCEWPPTCTVTFVCEATCEELTTRGTRFPGGACATRPEPCDTWEPWMYDYFGYPQPSTGITVIKDVPKKPEAKHSWPDWLKEYFGYDTNTRPMPEPCDTFPSWVNQFLSPEDDKPVVCDDWVAEYLLAGDACGRQFDVVAREEPEIYEPVYVTRVIRDTVPDEKTASELAAQEAELKRWASLPCPAWEIEYLRGCLPPGGGVPIQKLACAIAMGLCGESGSCTIPFGVTELQREGVELDMRQAWASVQAGGTGLYEVDMWVKKVNPMGLTQRVTVHRADQYPRPRNQTLHRIC